MRSALIALALFYVEVASAACPTNFVDDGGWHTSDPAWSADATYVITTFSLSNDASGNVVQHVDCARNPATLDQ
jgi:hypothetical protein